MRIFLSLLLILSTISTVCASLTAQDLEELNQDFPSLRVAAKFAALPKAAREAIKPSDCPPVARTYEPLGSRLVMPIYWLSGVSYIDDGNCLWSMSTLGWPAATQYADFRFSEGLESGAEYTVDFYGYDESVQVFGQEGILQHYHLLQQTRVTFCLASDKRETLLGEEMWEPLEREWYLGTTGWKKPLSIYDIRVTKEDLQRVLAGRLIENEFEQFYGINSFSVCRLQGKSFILSPTGAFNEYEIRRERDDKSFGSVVFRPLLPTRVEERNSLRVVEGE